MATLTFWRGFDGQMCMEKCNMWLKCISNLLWYFQWRDWNQFLYIIRTLETHEWAVADVPDVVHAVLMSLHQRFDVSGWNGVEQQHFCLLTGHSQHRPKHRHSAAAGLEICPAASFWEERKLSYPSGEYSRLNTAPWVCVLRFIESVVGLMDE